MCESDSLVSAWQYDLKRKIISRGRSESFLVWDPEFRKHDAPFFDWLRKEGFEYAWYHGHWGCEWIYVNITKKEFAYGMPGVAITTVTGNHAITKEEFLQIYGIFKRYDGEPLFACRTGHV
ncbi:MAG: hypothetical protein IK066_05360 [Kiritimatiellae bacterium]|nr:hypothetical protein [Kiritimatiellia bacterium]